ncbi:MAG TPA: Ig-like domain-containing protein [Gemmatimonadaceae bacterium]
MTYAPMRVSLTRAAAFIAIAAMLAACSKKDSTTAPTPGFTITADASTNAQIAPVGTAATKPIAVHVADQNGAVIPNAVVTWTVVSHAGTTTAATSMTDATGTATMTWTLDTIARVDSMTASIQGGATATVTATGTPGPATQTAKFSGDAQTVASGATSAPMIVKVKDRYGNGVSGVAVAWVVSGGGTLSASSNLTDVTGQAQVTLKLGSSPATYTIQATAAALTAVSFHLTGT